MTQVLSLVIAALGVAFLVIGLMFLGLGAGRFYLSRKAGG
jgi:CTP-dependent riboflavin kinase